MSLSSPIRFIPLDFPNHINQHASSCHEADGIAYRHREPDTIQSPPLRQDGEQRNEEEHLSGNTQEDALTCVTDALEEVSDDHLSTHSREGCHNEMEGANSFLCQLGTGSEDVNDGSRSKFASQAGQKRDACRSDNAVTKHTEDTVVLPCTPVITHNWLHSLHKSHHDGHEQKDHSVHDSVGSDGHIASIFEQSVVANQDHQTCATVE